MAKESSSFFEHNLAIDSEINKGKPSAVIKYIERTFGPKDHASDKRQKEYAKFFNTKVTRVV